MDKYVEIKYKHLWSNFFWYSNPLKVHEYSAGVTSDNVLIVFQVYPYKKKHIQMRKFGYVSS